MVCSVSDGYSLRLFLKARVRQEMPLLLATLAGVKFCKPKGLPFTELYVAKMLWHLAAPRGPGLPPRAFRPLTQSPQG